MADSRLHSTRRRLLTSGRWVTRQKWADGRVDVRVDDPDGRVYAWRRRVAAARRPPPLPKTYDLGGEG